MNYVLSVNRRRILPFYLIVIILLGFIANVFLIIPQEQMQYLTEFPEGEISDGTEFRLFQTRKTYGEEDIRQLIQKYDLPQPILNQRKVELEEYFLVENINLVLQTSGQKDYFSGRKAVSREQHGKSIEEERLEFGYCEGWKVLIRQYSRTLYGIWFALALVLLPVMGSDERQKTEQLVRSTPFGQKHLIRSRVINGMEISVSLFLIGVFLHTLFIGIVYSFEGYDLTMETWKEFLFFPHSVTFLTYYLYKIAVGFLTTLCVGSLMIFLGDRIRDLRLAWAIVIAYLSVHFTLFPTLHRKSFLFLLSPLQMIEVESLFEGLPWNQMVLYYGLSIALPLVMTILLILLTDRRRRPLP